MEKWEEKMKDSTGGGQVACSQGRDVWYLCFRPPGLLTLSLLDLKSRGTKDQLAHCQMMLSQGCDGAGEGITCRSGREKEGGRHIK